MISKTISLYQAILALETDAEVERFFKDLCTPQELSAFQERWNVCQILAKQELSYREIHEKTGASVTTIGRVARFLKDEPYQGYTLVLERLKKKRGEK